MYFVYPEHVETLAIIITLSKKCEMTAWHKLDCEQITKDDPTCRCMQIDHHVGAYRVAKFVGLTR